jgi:Rps23 Pro-64 3,4-dihydroxylase Tpa1-like proline 4-hydroxylase
MFISLRNVVIVAFAIGVLSSLGFVDAVSSQEAAEDASSLVDDSIAPPYRTFDAFKSTVYVVPNFLPTELAIKWRDEMRRIWENTRPIRDGAETTTCDTEHDTFLFATNNDGAYRERINNEKVRSLEKMGARGVIARLMQQYGQFSYSKWELHPNHPLVKEMEEAFSTGIKNTVTDLLKPNHTNLELSSQLSDLFVTLYSTENFLSPHDDGTSGSWAFVVSLTDGPPGQEWNPADFGGGLQFECPLQDDPLSAATERSFATTKWCETVYPTFNSAVIFQTRLPGDTGPMHQVLPVNAKAESGGFYRFGLTGWYMDASDEMDEEAKKQRDMMRARD